MQTLRKLGLLAVGLACAVGLAAQTVQRDQNAPQAPSVVLPPVEAEVVYVDVSVADKDGRPVAGLRSVDFEVFEDGRRMDVVNFWSGAASQEYDAAEAEAGAPDDWPSSAPSPTPLPEERRVNLVVYVDNLNLDPVNRQRVFERVRSDFLVHLPPEYRVMVVSHDQGFRIRRPFTEDLAAVRETLGAIEKDHGWGVERDAERRALVRRIETAAGEARGVGGARSQAGPALAVMTKAELSDQVRNFADREAQAVRQSLTELARFVGLMGALPGRKLLVYVADGLSGRPGEALMQALANALGRDGEREIGRLIFSQGVERDVRTEFARVVEQANANRVTIYAVDAASAQAGFAVSAEDAGAGRLGDIRVWDAGADATYKLDRQSTLGYLADATGGARLAANSKLGQRLKELSEELVQAYALAYVPPHVGDGKFHKIEVKLARPGVQVRHREGYRDKSGDERARDAAYAALLDSDGAGAERNPLGLALEAGPPQPDGKGAIRVPLLMKLPIGRLRLVRQDEADIGKLTLVIVVQDAEGGLSPVQRRELPLRFPSGKVRPGENQTAAYSLPLVMKPGEYVVAVAARDELGGRRGAAALRVKL